MQSEQVVCILVSIYFDSLNLAYNKKKLHKTLDYWSWDILNFYFCTKGPGNSFSTIFVYDFSRKLFLMLQCINWLNFFVWLPLLLEILGNIMCFAIVFLPGCDVINFEIKLIMLIKLFLYMTKKSRQKIKYLENEKSFWGEIKSIFHHF